MKKRILLIIMLLILMLSSCGSSSGSSNGFYTNNIYDDIIISNDEKKVTYDLDLSLDCKDVNEITSDVDNYVESNGGKIKNLYEYYNNEDILIDSEKEYYIPINKLKEFILKYFPKDDSNSHYHNELFYEDITDRYNDLVNKILIKQESKTYYEGLMSECSTVSDKVLLRKEIDSLDEALFQLNSEKENLDYKINFAKVTISFELEEEENYSILYALLGMFIFGSIIAITIIIVVCTKGKRKKR